VKEIVEWDDFIGRFEAVEAVDVRARVGGYLHSVHFKDGALVKEGDLLFTIDKRPYQAALNRAQASVTAIQTRLDFARTDLERVTQLMRQGAAAERTLDERRQQFLQAQADIAGARAAVEQARLDLVFTEVRSSLSGRIGRKLISEGNLVNANDTLLTTIVALDPIYFYFDVDERSYLAYVRMARDGSRPSGRESAFEVLIAVGDERSPSLRGNMNFVDNRVDPSTGTVRGRAILDNKNHAITPGQFGRISIPGSGKYQAVLIPDEAITADQDKRIVYTVANDGSVASRVIRPGPRIDGYRVVRQGLTGEETIVINGLQRIRLGGRVAPQLVVLPPSR
jgi:RND family efflux transporter MFP subunit